MTHFETWEMPLIGAMVGLTRACDKSGFTAEADALLLQALSATEQSAGALTQKLQEEKARIAPDCAVCMNPCGATADADMERILAGASPETLEARELLWAALKETKGRVSEPLAFHKAIFSFGEDWTAERLREIRAELHTSGYAARKLTEADIPAVLALCQGNSLYYEHCPPADTAETLVAALTALPPRTAPADKFFLGFFKGDALVAVLDLILRYPNETTAFIGFFMTAAETQGRGLGTALIAAIAEGLRFRGFSAIRLAYAKTNPQAARFWEKNGFVPTGVETTVNGGVAVCVVGRKL